MRYQLPVSLTSYEKKTVSSEGWDNLPYGTHPIDPANEKVIISVFLGELNNYFAANLSVEADLSRAHSGVNSDTKVPTTAFIVVGASLAGRLCAALEGAGHNSVHIKTVSWRPTPDTIKRAAQELSEAVAAATSTTCIVFQFLDSAAFYARCEDGSLVPARQGLDENSDPDGRFHLDGELVVAPKELFLHTLKTSLPLLKAAGDLKKVLLSPLPRYWLTNCCEDIDHIANRVDEEFEEMLFSGVDDLRRFCKDYLFKNRLGDTIVKNTCQMLCTAGGGRITSKSAREEVAALWGPDPVHPSAECFNNLAANVVLVAVDSADKRNTSPPGRGSYQLSKRPRWLDGQAGSEVSPISFQPQFRGRGRGGGGGRGGRGHWHRGGGFRRGRGEF